MSEAVFIVAMGARTPLGNDAWSTAAAVRAGISAFSQHPYMIDTAGQPMRVAMSPSIDPGLQGVQRLEALLHPAIGQTLLPLAAGGNPLPRMALALAASPPRAGVSSQWSQQLLQAIQQRHARHFQAAAVFAAGHASALLGLNAVCAKLRQGELDACLVAGVDSHLEPETLEALEADDQLHGAGPLNNAWGFIPGEAGAAVLLMRESVARERGLTLLAAVLGTGAASEPKHIKTDTVCLGEGLTQACGQALAALPAGHRVSDVYCDMNGEPYRADEYGFTALRLKEHFESASDFVAPADCWGDVAAASGVLHLILACAAEVKRYARGPLALVWASSEGSERAAVLMGPTQTASLAAVQTS